MEGLGLLFLLWIVGQILERVRGRQRPPAEEVPPEVLTPPTRGRQEPVSVESAEDAWRRELEQLFGVEVERGPVGRQAPVELPPAEEVEERETLETLDTLEEEERLISLDERAVEAPRPVVLDREPETRVVLQERLAVAERHSKPLTRADHARFDAEIRAVPARPAPVRRARPTLRQALVWREILGPPLSLRDRD